MISCAPARLVPRALFSSVALLVALVGASVAHAEEAPPRVGGSVGSVLGLTLGEPSPFSRLSVGRGRSVYTATIRVEVTATEAPTRLTIADGEASAGRRRGHLVRGASILAAPLRAAGSRGAYRSLDVRVDPLLELWSEPVANATAKIWLRQTVRGRPRMLRGYHKLLLVTVSAAGP